MTDKEFKDEAVLGIGHKESDDRTDCVFYRKEDKKCHFAVVPTFCTNCAAYQCGKMCGVCIHHSECNTDITAEICERFEKKMTDIDELVLIQKINSSISKIKDDKGRVTINFSVEELKAISDALEERLKKLCVEQAKRSIMQHLKTAEGLKNEQREKK